MAKFTPQEIRRFEDWLKDREDDLKSKITNEGCQVIIEHVFKILFVELKVELADADADYSQKFDERREMSHDEMLSEFGIDK